VPLIQRTEENADTQELRVNWRIRAREVRVISDSGEQLGIMLTQAAVTLAEEQGLDLVEVAAKSVPPVCKIMDYGKHKYETKKKAQESRSRQHVHVLKEVKVRPKTDDHDLDFKMEHMKRFLAEGNKVKVTMMFRGREIFHLERSRAQLEEIANKVVEEGIATIEVAPRQEGRNMHLILAPKVAR
jgi:translation initiation factor IF-3